MSARDLRFGLIGCGNLGAVHARCVSQVGGARFTAFADAVPAAAERLSAEHGGGYATDDIPRLLGDPDLDAVYICTHHDSHAPLAIAAARAGKHILIEKPLSLSVEECEAVAAAVEEAGVWLMPAFKMRYYPLLQKAREFIPEPQVIVGQMMDDRWRDDAWAQDPVRGGANVYSQGCHTTDVIRWMARSEPELLWAAGGAMTHPGHPRIDQCVASIRFASGTVASWIQGDAALGHMTSKFFLELFGGGRSVQLHDRFKAATFRRRAPVVGAGREGGGLPPGEPRVHRRAARRAGARARRHRRHPGDAHRAGRRPGDPHRRGAAPVSATRLIQYRTASGERRVGVVADRDRVDELAGVASTLDLAREADATGRALLDLVAGCDRAARVDYQALVDEHRLLPPIDHPDPAHLVISGTGLNHTGSAMARDAMHGGSGSGEDDDEGVTDSIRMFRLGARGGKPPAGTIGVAPEWFYKGDGSILIPPEHELPLPGFAGDGGEEAEAVAIYLIGRDGRPRRVGFALGNEFADHVIERQNYLYLAHSKLRACSIGPELLLGPLPDSVQGEVRVRRGGEVLWQAAFLTGEANMTHSLANMEHHLFKYDLFRRPGDVHCHFLGAPILSCAHGIEPQAGDRFEIESPLFARPLRNPSRREAKTT